MARSPQFFADYESTDRPGLADAPGPELPICISCEVEANPAWGSPEGAYCILCAPDDLRRPTLQNLPQKQEEQRHAPSNTSASA
jgi:hypothetical protein